MNREFIDECMRYTGTSLLTVYAIHRNEPIDGNECRQCTKRVYAIHETSVCDTQRTSASNAHEEDNEAQVVCNESEQWNAQGLCVSQAAMISKQEGVIFGVHEQRVTARTQECKKAKPV